MPKRFYKHLLDLFLPSRCLLCGVKLLDKWDIPICHSCQIDFQKTPSSFCRSCGKCLESGHICQHCLEGFYKFSHARFLASYEGRMAKAIAAIKYEYKTELIRPLVVMLFRKLENCDEQFLSDLKKSDYIIPVPLYSDRLRNRMFNQAGLIGKHLSKYLAVPVDYGILDRVKPTIPLANLNPKERLRVLKGAFRVVNPSPLEGKKVILVDDILTTGATANECARVLLKAGASCINLITFARA